jgi:chaperonin cofactor prefoldin
MKNLEKDPKKFEAELSRIEEQMTKAHRRLEVLRSEGWGLIQEWLAGEIMTKLTALVVPGTDTSKTECLRGEYWALRRLQDLPEKTDEEMQELLKRVQGLRSHIERLHTSGRPELANALDSASRLSSNKGS